jgi:hypothetical protein
VAAAAAAPAAGILLAAAAAAMVGDATSMHVHERRGAVRLYSYGCTHSTQ